MKTIVKVMILTNKQREDAAQYIINTRELCGNEKEAFIDWCHDNGIKPNNAIYRQANFLANAIWNKYQREAGVNEKYLF